MTYHLSDIRFPSYADVFNSIFLCHWSHVFSVDILSQELFKWRKQDLLGILKWEISIFSLFTCIDTDGTDDKLLFGVDFHKLLLSWNLVTDRRHRTGLHSAA